ncbi:pectinesterase family protein [Paenibacillus sp. y28]|uniref:pectinesterase family protein n=1 Tax=Paenibacillus sp. y28 TaxID=3129110 RepID=UPI00301808F2
MNSKTESMISSQAKAVPYSLVGGAPAAPSGFTAAADDGRVLLSWDTVTGASSYTVKRKAAAESAYTPVAAGLTAAGFEDTTVINGVQYAYIVTAVNDNGESGESAELLVMPAEVITVDPAQPTDASNRRYQTIAEAVASIPANNAKRMVVFIKAGTYHEKITVAAPYVSLVGEGRGVTVIEYNDYGGTDGQSGNVGGTFNTPTVAVTGNDFNASNLTIQNSAGPRNVVGTAVALSVKSDQSVFDNVELLGYQDTLYTGTGKQYYRNSRIVGDVDFIFGEAPAVVFDNNEIVSASQVAGGGGHITAAGQASAGDPGYVFLNSRVVQDSSATGSFDLGRPWKQNPAVRFINTYIDSHIIAAGWVSWNVQPAIYAEYNSYGPGANAAGRSTLLSRQLSADEAGDLTIPRIFGGWDPSVPVILPKANPSPVIAEKTVLFDRNTEKSGDITIAAQAAGSTLASVTNEGDTLQPETDYSVAASGYTIHRSYLAELSFGVHELTFTYTSGYAVTVEVVVVDSTMVQTLAPGEGGWASYVTGVSGGINAAPANITVVTNRGELLAALGGANAKTNAAPKMIYVQGTIDMNTDDNNNPLYFDDYRVPNYDLDQYVAAYDPQVWGRTSLPIGPLEAARKASQVKREL